MAVKWLMHWQPKPGSTLNSQIVSEVCNCVESLGGVGIGKGFRWKSVVTYYKPMLRDPAGGADLPRDFLGVALHDQPQAYFFILRPHRLILHADNNIQTIMDKLQSYKARVVLNFEGFQYRLGDFVLRVGKCVPSMSESLRGIMMEVEYLPISSIDKSRQIMEEFFDIWQEVVSKKSLSGHFINVESNFKEYGLQDQYTPQHTAVQYVTCMTQLMASVRNT